MKHPRYSVLAAAALVVGAACQDCGAQNVILWDRTMVGSARLLYAGMRTEFAGCLYGLVSADTVFIHFFVPASGDPGTATDSSVVATACPSIDSDRLIGVLHSHIRYGGICAPSGFPQGDQSPPLPPDSLKKDRRVLWDWMQHGALFSAIMCAKGDSIIEFSIDSTGVLTAFGAYRLPPLDSLYPRHARAP